MNEALPPHHFAHAHTPLPHLDHIFGSPQVPPALASQHELDTVDFNPFDPQLDTSHDLSNPFAPPPPQYDHRGPPPRFHEIRSNAPVNGFQQNQGHGQGQIHSSHFAVPQRAVSSGQGNEYHPSRAQFGVLTPHPIRPQMPSQPNAHHDPFGPLEARAKQGKDGGISDGHFSGMKMIPNPPNLEEWRKKLFEMDEPLTLTEDEFQTYFPHVDNIYSHRSTQRYKRKPFVSHYWDCRLKGRPPGTAKSDDPNKKKRKRTARERDLCDVKIKITEHFSEASAGDMMAEDPANTNPFLVPSTTNNHDHHMPGNFLGSDEGPPPLHQTVPVVGEGRYYTIQRVNGNGANGKELVSPGGHKHSMDESDKVKKNSIVRHFLKEEKDRKRSQKTYHKKATGSALVTVKKHAKEHDLKLYGSCFCPFVQRVWISLELKGISYQYIEIDPYRKPDELLAINPRGLIPALAHDSWSCYESSVLMEYLEDLNAGFPLLPQGDAKHRATCRLWADHINRKILPHFYGLLQAQEPEKQAEQATLLKGEIAKLIDAADTAGPFFLGPHISFVDVQFAPWILRLRRVLKPYRSWPMPDSGSRWARWIDAIESNEGVKATTSSDDVYLDSYERYAENRPNTSQVANAVNAGGELP